MFFINSKGSCQINVSRMVALYQRKERTPAPLTIRSTKCVKRDALEIADIIDHSDHGEQNPTLSERFPVIIHADCILPSQAKMRDALMNEVLDMTKSKATHEALIYNRHVKYQRRKCRIDQAIKYFNREPTFEVFQNYCLSLGWKEASTMKPIFYSLFTPSESRVQSIQRNLERLTANNCSRTQQRRRIADLAKSQNWPYLEVLEHIQFSNGTTGRGVITTVSFKQGDVVCDYHADEIDRETADSYSRAEDNTDRRSDYLMKVKQSRQTQNFCFVSFLLF